MKTQNSLLNNPRWVNSLLTLGPPVELEFFNLIEHLGYYV